MTKDSDNHIANISFSDVGRGKVIVLLHGFLESSAIWDEFADDLSANFRVITIDLPGHGNSDCINEEHSMEMMAEEVKNILEILGIEKCLLAGHSLGGYVAAAFAEKYREMLKGIIFFHSHAFADTDETQKNRDRMIELIEKDRSGFIFNFIPDLFSPENRIKFGKEINGLVEIANKTCKKGIIAAIKGMKNRKDRSSIISGLKIPVLYILGKYDSRTPLEKILYSIEKSQNAVSVVLENANHMGFIEEKKQTLEIIRNFAESVF